MPGVSGQYGSIATGSSNVFECTKWSFSRKAAVHQYATCFTAGYKKAVAGVKSGEGEISGVYDPANPIDGAFQAGDAVTLKLYTTASKFYSVPSIIGEVSLEVDIEDGEVVRWSAPFTANGAWSLPA